MSGIPSGPVISAAMYASSDCPLIASTIRPAQLRPIPYSQSVPGSKTSGTCIADSARVATLGVAVTAW